MRKDQRGFTIVELIIAVAILAIVTLAVGGFMVVGSRSYTSANTDIMLQQDAQLALNQISDVIIDTTDSISYSVGDSSGLQTVLKDSEYGGEATDKCLTVVNRKEPDSNNDNPSYWFYWSKEKETIYFNEVPVDSTMSEEEIKNGFADAEIAKAVLAEHVTDLQIDVSQFEENRVVMISMTFENGGRQYSTSNNVTVRNRIALNAIDVAPMKIADEFLITNLSPVTLEPGDDYTFEAHVDTSSDDRELKCELSGNADSDTRITGVTTADGGKTVRIAVHVGIKEMGPNFLLKVSRAHEQYEGQNKRVSVSAQIKVKRVNAVNITGPASAKQGATVSLTGSASGPQLGYSCNSAACAGDEIAKDHDLIDTRWVVTSGNATIANPTKNSADVMIAANAVPGEDVVVRAYSQLSATKNGGYGIESQGWSAPIYGEWRIRVEQGVEGDAPLRSDFKFGTDNDEENGMILDYMYNGLHDAGKYVMCVRVREMNSSNKDDDQVILYYSNVGKNLRFYPDMFGLELNRQYKVYMQVLVPVPEEIILANNGNVPNDRIHNYDGDIITEYNANLNSMGKYVGTKYQSSILYYGTLAPPAISIVLNGVTYPNDNKDYYEYYSLLGNEQRAMEKINLGTILNIKANTVESDNMVKFSIYKEENGGRKLVCGYNPATMQYEFDNKFGNGMFTISPVGNLTGDPFIMRDINNHNISGVSGTYYIVPGYEYANKKNLRNYNFIWEHNLRNDYDLHYYTQENCTITWKITDGLNLQMPTVNGETRWAYFPVPSDFRSFPFARKSSYIQTATRSFASYSQSGDYREWFENVMVDCRYNEDSDSYTIWLYKITSRDGASYKRHVYGRYRCKNGGEEWTPEQLDYDEQVEVKTNLTFTKDGNTYEAYFPAPTDKDFPFAGITEETTIPQYWIEAYNKNNNYEKSNILLTVKGTPTGGSVTIELTQTVNAGSHKKVIYDYGTYGYDSAKGEWTMSDSSSVEVQPVWRPGKVEFTYNGNPCVIEIPLPGDSDFPKFSGTYETTNLVYYLKSDTYGENAQNPYGGLKLIYTRNAGGGYTVRLDNGYYSSGTPYGTWTWQEGQSNWKSIP